MTEDVLYSHLDPVLQAAGAVLEDGEEFRTPPLDVLRYYRRPVRLHWLPVVGQGLSVIAFARQPVDTEFSVPSYRTMLTRLAMAANGRFPPWSRRLGPALVVGLTAVILTPEPIGPQDDSTLREIISGRPLPRQRAVPMGLLRINLGQEALAHALASGPPGLFPESGAMVDALTPHLRRFVPLMDLG